MKYELRSTVITKMLASSLALALAESIPSVSIRRTVNLSQSITVVPIQIPNVLASIVWPSAKSSADPSTRESTYDFPVRHGPPIANTARGRSMVSRSWRVSGTSLRLVRCSPGIVFSSLVETSYLVSLGMTSGIERWLAPLSKRLVNFPSTDIL